MKSILKWFGGKYYLLKYILPFPQHEIYIEVFGGSAVILLNKIPSRSEIYNDINERLINFWSVLKNYKEELKYLCNLKNNLDSRKLFEKYKEKSNDSIEDAFRFLYINHHSFSGDNNTYHGIGFSSLNHNHGTYLHQIEKIDKISERIQFVRIECQDFRILLNRCDHSNVFLYLDPPYILGGKKYEKGIGGIEWNENDIKDLYIILKNLKKAKFVLSFDNKDYFNAPNWFYQKIERINQAASTKTKNKGIEYIIRNFDLDKIISQKSKNQKRLTDFNGN